MMDWRSKSGASMVIALVTMIVFLTIGTSVLLAAKASTASASNLMRDKRLYYFANSVAQTVTGSLENGGALQGYFAHVLEENKDAIELMREAEPTELFEMTCTLSSGDMPEAFRRQNADGSVSDALHMEPLAVSIDPRGVMFDPDADGKLASVSRMKVDFTVYYGEQSYHMQAEYLYETAREELLAAAGNGTWRLVRYTQTTPAEEAA